MQLKIMTTRRGGVSNRKDLFKAFLRLLVAVASAASDVLTTKWAFGFIPPAFLLPSSSSSLFLRLPTPPPAAAAEERWTIPPWRPGQKAAATVTSHHATSLCDAVVNEEIQVGTCTIAGMDSDRPQKVNQDAFFSTHFRTDDNDQEFVCAGVMDGHGLKGHVVTHFLAKQMPICIQKQLHQPQRLLEWEEKVADLGNYHCQHQQQKEKNRDDVQHQILINAFHQAHVQAMESPEVPAGRSGTTCITCLVGKDDIHVASVGDSRAIRIFLISEPTKESSHKAATSASNMIQVLATETTVQNMPNERARVETCIQKQQQEQGGGGGIRIDVNGNVWYGPVAIAMTRALGDAVMLRAGVIPTPIVEAFSRRSSSDATTASTALPSSLIIMATDGIWDVLNNDQVAEIAQGTFALTKSVGEVASILSQTARQRWKGDIDMPLMDEKCDDITCVCIHC